MRPAKLEVKFATIPSSTLVTSSKDLFTGSLIKPPLSLGVPDCRALNDGEGLRG